MQNKVLPTFFFSFFRKKFYFTLTFLFLFSFFGLAMVQLLTRLKRRLDPRLYASGVCVCLFFFFLFFFSFFFFFSHVQLLLFITVYILFTHLKILKINSTVLFTYLKIILLQCFQFSIFSKNKLYPNEL